ncbi:MAG: hypothetical protein GX275_14560 [Clostridiales bacterium]|nr:hypothetical protein [Clostridiales bacterium]
MDSEKLIELLEENGLSEVEVKSHNSKYVSIEFSYEYDYEETSAAREYANEESDFEEDSREWTEDWYSVYLDDIVNDNVQEIIEEICEELDIEAEFKKIEEESQIGDVYKGIIVFCYDSTEIDMESLLSEY